MCILWLLMFSRMFLTVAAAAVVDSVWATPAAETVCFLPQPGICFFISRFFLLLLLLLLL